MDIGNLSGIFYGENAQDLNESDFVLPQSETTIAQSLSTSNYKNIFLGKWHSGSTEDLKPIIHGYDEYLAFNIISQYLPRNHPDAVRCTKNDIFDDFIHVNARYHILKDGGPYFEPKGYLTDYLAEEASRGTAYTFTYYISMHQEL